MAKQKQKTETSWIPFDLKPDRNFKMAKQTKRILALGRFSSEEDRHSYKRAMINAQLAEEASKRTPLKRDKEDVSA
jgi:hypothetical protein